MRKPKQNSGLWLYLEQQGKLDASKEERIALTKAYRKQYEREFKRKYRQKRKEYTVIYEKAEVAEIEKAAKAHGLSEAVFLKRAVWGYLKNVYLVRDKSVLDRVLQILLRYQCTIEQVKGRDKGAWYKPDRNYRELEQAINAMREQIVEVFAHPPLLSDVIKTTLKGNPSFYEVLKNILADHGT